MTGKALTNCPNCNGILSYAGGLHCDYCGARFEEPGHVTLHTWDGEAITLYDEGDSAIWSQPDGKAKLKFSAAVKCPQSVRERLWRTVW